MATHLSVIIVNWNTCELLEQCLSSVYANLNGLDSDIWVVDNASQDESVAMIREHFPGVNLIENPRNVGFAEANNLAIRKCTGEYVLLLNPDTKLKSCSLNSLLTFMKATPHAGAAGARLLNADGSLQISTYPQPSLFREFWRMFKLDFFWPLAVYSMNQWDLNNSRQVDVLMGACMIIRKKALDQVGLLDENFFMYSEEVDLCYRIKKSGWNLFWVPEAEVIHYGGQSTKLVAEEMFLRLYESKILYFRKHYSHGVVSLYKAILYSASAIRLLITPLILLLDRPKRQENLTLFQYYRRLISSLSTM